MAHRLYAMGNGTRFYDPDLGQFLEKDPVYGDINDPRSMSPYAYAFNNPVWYQDRTGKQVPRRAQDPALRRGGKFLDQNGVLRPEYAVIYGSSVIPPSSQNRVLNGVNREPVKDNSSLKPKKKRANTIDPQPGQTASQVVTENMARKATGNLSSSLENENLVVQEGAAAARGAGDALPDLVSDKIHEVEQFLNMGLGEQAKTLLKKIYIDNHPVVQKIRQFVNGAQELGTVAGNPDVILDPSNNGLVYRKTKEGVQTGVMVVGGAIVASPFVAGGEMAPTIVEGPGVAAEAAGEAQAAQSSGGGLKVRTNIRAGSSEGGGAPPTPFENQVPAPVKFEFANLEPKDIPRSPSEVANYIVELKQTENGWVQIGANGTNSPEGRYVFIQREGKLSAARVGGENPDLGHIDLANGKNVEYAGEVSFAPGGHLEEWSNASGHYRPTSELSRQANLPQDKFRPSWYVDSYPGTPIPVYKK